MNFFSRFSAFILAIAILLSGCGCRYIFKPKEISNNHAPTPAAPTPARELNENRLPSRYFNSWHRSKPGMILTEGEIKTFYLDTPGSQPADFSDYKIERYNRRNPALSHSGKFEITVNKKNERSESSGCCAIQRFDYDVILSEVAAPENQTKLLADASAGWEVKGWSPDDKFILFQGVGELFLMDAETKEKTTIFKDRGNVRFAFAKDSKGLFLISYDNKETQLEYFDFTARQLTKVFSPLENGLEMTLSPDAKTLALFVIVSMGATTQTAINRLHLFDAETRSQTREFDLPKGEISVPFAEAWKPDRCEIAFNVGGEDFALDVYSLRAENGKITGWYPPEGKTTKLYK